MAHLLRNKRAQEITIITVKCNIPTSKKHKKTTLYKIPHLDTKENINIDTYFDQNIPCRTDTRSNKSTISKNI